MTRHTYDPDENGVCQATYYTGTWAEREVRCRSTQRSSVLHDDPESDFREQHDHGGGDCMCFEDPEGPSYYDAMRAYVAARGGAR